MTDQRAFRWSGPVRRIRRDVFGVLLATAALVAAIVSAAPPARADPAVPEVLPALQSWTPAHGSLLLSRASRIVVDRHDSATMRVATTFASDLRAETGWPSPVVGSPTAGRKADITLERDRGRSDLGAEGYQLVVGRQVKIIGATEAGVFYGTRTVLQLLASGHRLPAGSATDVPKSAERGVAVCACYTYNTIPWMDRLIKDMAYLKLNQLHLELKVRNDEMPKINTFSYYTPSEIKHIVTLAAKYHITVTPEINSPGHIDPYIANYPDLQLVGTDGKADPSRLDITKPEAFTFYTKLIDAYLKLFPGAYWHMGADEYMLGSAYSNYPQLLDYAKKKYGPKAVAQDAYVDFINRVDAYVRSKGRTLRIWNDGLTGQNTVPINSDIVVEYWTGEDVKPQDLLDAGHKIMNASSAFYYTRGGSHPDSASLYQNDWSPLVFPGQTVKDGQAVTGAELAVWPDNYGQETENTTQTELFDPLRVFAQAVWGSPKPTTDYPSFQKLATALGHAPGWGKPWDQPLPDGSYVIADQDQNLVSPSTAAGQLSTQRAKQTWRLQKTTDGYYRMVSDSSGLCADVQRGEKNGSGVVEQAGAPVTAETCNQSTSQEWQIERVGNGYRLVDAITQQAADVASGGIVQQPRDVAHRAVWHITPSRYVAPVVTVTPDPIAVKPGASSDVTITIDNSKGPALNNAHLTLQPGAGWTVSPEQTDLGTIRRGAILHRQATLTAPDHNASGALTTTIRVSADGLDNLVRTSTATTAQSAHSVYSQSYDGPSYKRLTRQVAVPAGGGSLTFWTNYATEQGWDQLFVEAHTPGQDDWTTLPDVNGHTSTEPGDSCTNGWVTLHPQLAHYQTQDGASCTPTGTTGSWNAASGSSDGWTEWKVDLSDWSGKTVEVSIAYVSDWGGQEKGVYVDDTTLPDGTTSTFEDDGLDGWTVSGAPSGEPANPNDFVVTTTP